MYVVKWNVNSNAYDNFLSVINRESNDTWKAKWKSSKEAIFFKSKEEALKYITFENGVKGWDGFKNLGIQFLHPLNAK